MTSEGFAVLPIVHSGISIKSLKLFHQTIRGDWKELSLLLGLTGPVNKEALNAQQSVHLWALAELYWLGELTFGSIEKFRRWLSKPKRVLNNQSGKELLLTTYGIGLISQAVGRIAHGIAA
ncbi:MAG: MbcA/ParS/Xre antitoxin family protein [Bacteroidota bacterium]